MGWANVTWHRHLLGDPNNPGAYPPLWSNLYYHRTCLRQALEKIRDEHLDHYDQAVLVDYGCGVKPYEQLFGPAVRSYLGLDVESADEGDVDHVLQNDGTSTLKDEVADIVLSTQVLEHVPDPSLYLEEARRLLRRDGLLILSTHGHMMYHPVPDDYWRWTRQGLRRQLTKCGFDIIEVRGLMGVAATGGQYVLDGVRKRLPRFLAPLVNLWMQGVIWLLDSHIVNPDPDKDASIFVAVAAKNPNRS